MTAAREKSHPFLSLAALYTLLWLVGAACLLVLFRRYGKAFLWIEDGIYQHFVSFDYLCQYLRALLIDRSPLPVFNFTLGQGADVITTLSSYDFFDPVCVLSALFFPLSRLQRYTLMIFLKLWLVGLSFLAYCFAVEKREPSAVLSGAIVYAFSGVVLYTAARHPNFANWAYYFPFLLTGVELSFRKGKRLPLILAVFFNLVTSFYTFYINAVLTALYVVVTKLIRKPAQTDQPSLNFALYTLNRILKLVGPVSIGVLLSSFILLPTLLAFLNNPRVTDTAGSAGSAFSYGWPFYRGLIETVFEPGYVLDFYTAIGLGVLCFVPLVLLFTRKGHGRLKALVLLSAVMLCLPVMGRLLNGMSYPSNRWSYALVFYCSFALVALYDDMQALTKTERWLLPLLAAVLGLLVLLLARFRRTSVATATALMLFAAVLLFVLVQTLRREKLGPAVLALAMAGALFQIWFTFSGRGAAYVDEFLDAADVPACYTAFSSSAAVGRGEGFYRIERQEEEPNPDGILRSNGTSAWWSTLPEGYLQYYDGLNLNTVTANCNFYGLDARPGLLQLASVRYYTCPADQPGSVPFGYREVESPDPAYRVFENPNPLPIGFTFDRAMTRTAFDALGGIEKEQALLQAAVLDRIPEGLTAATPETEQIELEYTFIGTDGAVWDGRTLDAGPMGSLSFSAAVPEDCEVYALLKGARPADRNKMIGAGVGRRRGDFSVEKWAAILSPDFNWYFPRDTVAFNLGYGHPGENTFTLTLWKKSCLALDEIRLVAVPMAAYPKTLDRLGEFVLEDAVVGRDRITGTVTVPDKRLLQFAVPFSAGWKAFVDGKETPVLQSDVLYMSVLLDPGAHTVELRYSTPGLAVGCLLSALTLLALCVCGRKRKKS